VARISEIGELALIDRIRAMFGVKAPGLAVSVGDDAAVFESGGDMTVLTTDLMCEGIHFDYSYTTPYQTAFRLITSNVSDIFAMGGRPEYAVLNMAMNGGRTEEEFNDFLDGIKDACSLYGIVVVGGDLSASTGGDFFSATLSGRCVRPVLRSGAVPGDGLFVTGTLGDAAAGLAFMRRHGSPLRVRHGESPEGAGIAGAFEGPVRRHLLPVARDPSAFLDSARAMMDISDGLLIDTFRLCAESGTGVVIYEEALPLSDGLVAVAEEVGAEALEMALTGGEDYELLVVSGREEIEGLTRIGEMTEAGCFLADSAGNMKEFGPRGYTHF